MSSFPASTPPQTSPMALVSLIAGILGFTLFPLIGSIVAIVTGHMARGEIRRAAAGTLSGDGLAVAGLALGYAALLLALLTVMMFVLFFGGLAALAFWNH